MSPRVRKKRPVKGVSANLKQTQEGGPERWTIPFSQRSDPQNPHFDPFWYESDDISHEDPWFDIVGEFLFRKAIFKSYVYKGKHPEIREKSQKLLETIKERLEEIESHIRYKRLCTNLTLSLMGLAGDVEKLKHLKAGFPDRRKMGKYDRGTALKKQWYALCVLRGQALKVNRPLVNRRLAKAIEEMRTGKFTVPTGFELKWFTKMLHEKSNIKNPQLSLTYTKNFNQVDIIKMADKANVLQLPPVWEQKLSI